MTRTAETMHMQVANKRGGGNTFHRHTKLAKTKEGNKNTVTQDRQASSTQNTDTVKTMRIVSP